MKRSEINAIIRHAIEFCRKMNFMLPPFVYWKPEEWAAKGSECSEIVENQLGWDITDFGSGDFYKVGLTLITLRNGNPNNEKYRKTYAEKIMIVRENQVTPMHYHYRKYEDIINRGGGNLAVMLYNRAADDALADTPVTVSVDGVTCSVHAGGVLVLKPGESICMHAGLYHSFWGQAGTGNVLVGEVSRVNDDHSDNRFYEPTGRFPEIEEDEAPIHLLSTEYPKLG